MDDQKNTTVETHEETKKSDVALKEEAVLEFWKENNIFQKTLEKDAPNGEFVFYEGPPTANAKPALHHLEARVFKDIIPRYKTMRGFHVGRKGGWDTHGLPVELQIEKKLGLKSKKEIESFGIEKFNQECKESVFQYISDWEKFTDRIGYWVDKDNAYYTFDNNYIESLWAILKTVNEKKLLYKDYKVVPWCPRCGTALSSHELAQGYQEDKDLSVTPKFKLLPDQKFGENKEFVTGQSAYILAWTTTPWTLPGNVGLAVGEKISYSAIRINEIKELLIVATDLVEKLFKDNKIEIVHTFNGSGLIGLRYEPLYNFLSAKFESKNPESFAKAYQVYAADFVNTEDGTGIVHTAVMYGQEDFELGTSVGLPKYHLVKDDGHFLDDMDFLSGRFVKEVDENGKPTLAVDIINDLKTRGLFFSQENIKHSYPHCWRCKTPLIYYARDSWYIRMSSLRNDLVAENEKINWEPAHIKEGRFGEWLREVKDWAISRERYWGTPLPVWSDIHGNYHVIGSIEELKKLSKKSNNGYFVMRHGEAENNAQGIYSSDPNKYHLTEKGKNQVSETAEELKKKEITVIYASPFLRTKETAEMVASHIGFPVEKIIFDDRLRELDFGEFSERPITDYWEYCKNRETTFDSKIPGGESYQDTKRRFGEFLYEIDQKRAGENILIISHGIATEILPTVIEGANKKRSLEILISGLGNKPAQLHREHEFIRLPHNENFELDLHKPFIDGVNLVDEEGNQLTRAKEVMDVWFDSGSMPFAQNHYPFDTKLDEIVDGVRLYPADFISEAIDQTRGWFYTLLAIGVLLDRGTPYKNVICLGHILDADGKKMSKSIGNIVEPWSLMNTYGVDALRLWMYSVNQPGDSKNFDVKTVDEIIKKIFNPLSNIHAFYAMYEKEVDRIDPLLSQNPLDIWILAELHDLIKKGTENLDNYKMFEPIRLLRDFVQDFSTWYLRRSRDRFKGESKQDLSEAVSVTEHVLIEITKFLAPPAPFYADWLYREITKGTQKESVHLENWPELRDVNSEAIETMKTVRDVVTSALELRQKAGHKVRQPLATLTIPNAFPQELLDIICDEVNVKKIEIVEGGEIKLDTDLTDELREEGIARDIIRGIQDARKKDNLSPSDAILLVVCSPESVQNIIKKYLNMITTPTLVGTVTYSNDPQTHEIALENTSISISIVR
ncbi:MAG: class I tRNA ligase family protein [Patescibacteria group bacterium]